MKKIYNNLSIENLMKTEWFKQFTPPQQEIVRLGLQENLDISWYNKPEYSSLRMNEIRIGLIDNLDVSIYAKKEFTHKQMEQIRLGLEDNLDVSIYAKPEISDKQMEQIREKLLKESTL